MKNLSLVLLMVKGGASMKKLLIILFILNSFLLLNTKVYAEDNGYYVDVVETVQKWYSLISEEPKDYKTAYQLRSNNYRMNIDYNKFLDSYRYHIKTTVSEWDVVKNDGDKAVVKIKVNLKFYTSAGSVREEEREGKMYFVWENKQWKVDKIYDNNGYKMW
jgi:hypothetical protein